MLSSCRRAVFFASLAQHGQGGDDAGMGSAPLAALPFWVSPGHCSPRKMPSSAVGMPRPRAAAPPAFASLLAATPLRAMSRAVAMARGAAAVVMGSSSTPFPLSLASLASSMRASAAQKGQKSLSHFAHVKYRSNMPASQPSHNTRSPSVRSAVVVGMSFPVFALLRNHARSSACSTCKSGVAACAQSTNVSTARCTARDRAPRAPDAACGSRMDDTRRCRSRGDASKSASLSLPFAAGAPMPPDIARMGRNVRRALFRPPPPPSPPEASPGSRCSLSRVSEIANKKLGVWVSGFMPTFHAMVGVVLLVYKGSTRTSTTPWWAPWWVQAAAAAAAAVPLRCSLSPKLR